MSLAELRDRVKALTGPDREVDLLLALLMHPGTTERDWLTDELERRAFGRQPNYTGSLDAAERLRNAVLPGWLFTVGAAEPGIYCRVWKPWDPDSEATPGPAFKATHPSEPIARVLATLAALIAKEGT